MQVTIEIPDIIAEQIARAGGDTQRALIEAFAVEEYRNERLSRGQISELLRLNFWETEEFLRTHNAYLHTEIESLEDDSKNLSQLFQK